MKYYRLKDNINFPKRWYLGEILGVDNWQLISSVPEQKNELNLTLYQDGEEMDFTQTEVYGVPIVSEKVKNELSCIYGIKFIPVNLEKGARTGG